MISKINMSPAVKSYQPKAVSFKSNEPKELIPIEDRDMQVWDTRSMSDTCEMVLKKMHEIDLSVTADKKWVSVQSDKSLTYHSGVRFFAECTKLLYNRVIGLTEENQKLESQKSELIGMLGYDPFQFAK